MPSIGGRRGPAPHATPCAIATRPAVAAARDLAGQVLRVVLDPAQQRRAARVQPGQPQEEQAGRGRDAARCTGSPAAPNDRGTSTKPWSCGEARRPDHRAGLEPGAVAEADRPAVRAGARAPGGGCPGAGPCGARSRRASPRPASGGRSGCRASWSSRRGGRGRRTCRARARAGASSPGGVPIARCTSRPAPASSSAIW